jgi:hypothetical protein
MEMDKGAGACTTRNERRIMYEPKQEPGFVAWVTAFHYGGESIGVSFKETELGENGAYSPPDLAMGEVLGLPVSYASIECGSRNEISSRVYMRSDDCGASFRETGRCPLHEGSFVNLGFPDGRIIGLDTPPRSSSENDGIIVRESTDGGSTWKIVKKLLPGCSVYIWRARRLRDGTALVLASLYGTVWGEGRERGTRNTMLPGETYIGKIQTFFLSTNDGISYSGPHYVLPGIGAHEYDVAERDDGTLVFIAGDVQATPAGRQLVTRLGDSFINGALLPIRKGAPPDPIANPQGGFIPESIISLPGDILVGSRRGKQYSCSNDNGENWHAIEGLPPSLYQPFMIALPDGRVANFGHLGGDNAFGQKRMHIGVDIFNLEVSLPASCRLSLERLRSEDGNRYVNAFKAALRSGGEGIPSQRLLFRFMPVWNPDGSVDTSPMEKAPIKRISVTSKAGEAVVRVPEYDGIADIHHFYNVDVVFEPEPESGFAPAQGPMMCVASLRPSRKCLYPHDAYFANGALHLSPSILDKHPDAIEALLSATTSDGARLDASNLDPALVSALVASGVLMPDMSWIISVHCPKPLESVKRMLPTDWYE